MKEIVLITGANGMLAKHLAIELENTYTIRFLTRKVKGDNEFLWDIQNLYIDPEGLKDVSHIIHLAGASIVNAKWTSKRKKMIYSSRIDSAQLILNTLKKSQQIIKTFISASAIGYYGTKTTGTILTEESSNGDDYLSKLCSKWESIAHLFMSEKVADRILIVRIGIILSRGKGALKKMVQPIQLGFGSGIGTGKQWMPWIHIADLSRMFKFILINKELHGVFNAVSPDHSTNIEVTKKIAKTINRKIFLPNIPKFVMKMIFGEMSVILLEGSRVSSNKVVEMGFNFKYIELESALNNVLKSKTD